MNTRSKKTAVRAHDRSAAMQWFAIVLVVLLGLIAALVLTDGGGTGSGGGHNGAPAPTAVEY